MVTFRPKNQEGYQPKIGVRKPLGSRSAEPTTRDPDGGHQGGLGRLRRQLPTVNDAIAAGLPLKRVKSLSKAFGIPLWYGH